MPKTERRINRGHAGEPRANDDIMPGRAIGYEPWAWGTMTFHDTPQGSPPGGGADGADREGGSRGAPRGGTWVVSRFETIEGAVPFPPLSTRSDTLPRYPCIPVCRPQTEDCSPPRDRRRQTASRAHPHPCSTLSDPSPASSSPPRPSCASETAPPSPFLSPPRRRGSSYPRPRRRLPTPQAAHTAERTRACARAHLRAVDRNLLKAHRPRRRERRNLLAQQIVQKRAVTAAKRAQTVIVHRNTAAKPHISRIPLAQQSQTARRTDPLQGRKQPQRQQNRRVRRRTTGTGNPRANLSVKPAQVQTLHETPNNPRPVVRRKQTLKVNHPPFQLTPIRAQNTNTTRHRNPLYSTRPKLNRTQQSKQINQILFLHSLFRGNDKWGTGMRGVWRARGSDTTNAGAGVTVAADLPWRLFPNGCRPE